MRKVKLMAALLGAAMVCSALPAKPAEQVRRPNFLVIVADDLGFSDLGAFGGEIATPNLDALAKSGIRLANFHTASACAPTRAMVLTGSDSHIAGLGNMPESMPGNQRGKPGYEGYLRRDVATIAERLRPQGYRTLFSGKWHLGVEPDQDPHARGFEHSFAMLQCCHDHFGKGISADPTKWFGYREDGVAITSLPADFYSSDYFADKLIRQFDSQGPTDARPFFAYLAFTAPHAPLQAPPETIAKYKGRYDAGYDVLRVQRMERQRALGLLDPAVVPHHPVDTVSWASLTAEEKAVSARKMEIYAAMVDRLDRAVGRVIAALKRRGEFDNTVIIFLSDNGAEARDVPRPGDPTGLASLATMGSAGTHVTYGAGWAQAATAPSWRFKTFSTEGGTHTPAFVTGFGTKRAGATSMAYTTAMDIAPTILDISRVPESAAGPAIRPIEGRSWAKFLARGAAVYPEDLAIGTELFGSRSITRGGWKIVDIGDGRWRLFNLAADPGETTDLVAQEPARMKVMLREWDRYAAAKHVVLPNPPFHPNPPKQFD